MSLIEELTIMFGLSQNDLIRIIASAPARYKVFEIPKKSGGWRVIAQPAKELKTIQRHLLETKLSLFPIHDAAAAYVKGRGIHTNAFKHAKNNFLLKLDFQDFFPSIVCSDWEIIANRLHKTHPAIATELNLRDIKIYSQILFWSRLKNSAVPRCLSIGAPTSPTLSNIIMFDIDVILAQFAASNNVVYTRYADDITISSENEIDILKFENEAKKVIRQSRSPRLTFNDGKRGLYRRGQRQMVTGLIITPQGIVSIGRDRKREISSLIHSSKNGKLSVDKQAYLKGMLGFVAANEPQLLDRFRNKYGSEVLTAAMAIYIPKRQIIS